MKWRVLEIMVETAVVESVEAATADEACEKVRAGDTPDYEIESVRRVAVPEGDEFPDTVKVPEVRP